MSLTIMMMAGAGLANATPFTETVPGGHGSIPNTYPPVGGTMFVLVGANGNLYYQFVNPSTQFEGFQLTGDPAAFRGAPTFQLGPQQNLNCGIVSCSDYFGGSIAEGYARLTVRDADACPGNFDYQDVSFEVNGFTVSSLSDLAAGSVERTDIAGTTTLGTENCFRNANTETSTAWFDLTAAPGLLNNILTVGSTTPFIHDDDLGTNTARGDNFWFFRDGQDATGTPEVAPGIRITKTADRTDYTAVGDVINYSFFIENIGSVTLNGIVVSDTFITGTISCPTNTLASGVNMTCTGQHIVTQANIDNDEVFVNTAEATANPTEGALGAVSGTLTIPGPDVTPSMSLTKAASDTTDANLGDVITYTYVARNTGVLTLNDVFVSDVHSGSGSLSAITPANVTLAPGASQTFTATYTITQADIDAGVDVTNVATGNATPSRGAFTPPTANAAVDLVDPAPSATLTKTADDTTDVTVGQTVTYTYTFENTGNVSINSVSVTDSHSGSGTLSAFTPANYASVAPGDTVSFEATYVVTQADIDAATDITNTATVSATPATGTLPAITADESVDVADAAPALTMTKTASDTSDVAVGDVITYSYEVTNSGNVSMSGVSISDSHSGSGSLSAITPASVDLAPGDNQTFTATYTVTQADVDAATDITNTATANATPATGTYTPVTADEVVDLADAAPALSFTKVADDTADVTAGQTITYTYTATNTGNVTMSGVSVSDSHSGSGALSAITPASVTLAPGDSQVFTATYVVTQADIDAATDITNTATANATPSTGTYTPVTADEVVDVADAAPAATLTKTASDTTDVATGDTITYSYELTNTGNVALNNASISDAHSGTGTLSAITPASVATLAPGDSQIFTATYVVTQADIEAESDITNTATLTATPASGTLPATTADETVDLADAAPALTFTKVADVTADAAVGDTITYTYTATNTGNVTINAVSVSDSHSGTGTLSAITPASVDLAPGDSQDFTATYVITQADVDAASDITNTATLSATPATGTLPVITADESVDLADPAPALTMTKTASDTTDVAADDVITYSYDVTNSGNISIDNVSVSDVHSGSGALSAITPASVSLAPGASQTFTATYTVTQADIDAASDITNTATATGDPSTGVLADVSDTETVSPDSPAPSADMTKTADITSDVAVGDTITYSYVLTNTGNVSLNAVSLSDSHSGTGALSAITPASVATLAPGASQTFTATYAVTQADIDAGADITNTATLTASPASGSLAPVSADETVDLDDVMPDFAVSKTASDTTDVAVGDVITYTYSFENTGNVTLSNISVSDVHSGSGALSAITPASVASLPVGQSATFTATYTVTQADIDAATDITNTATFAASSPAGALPTQTADESVDLDDPAPSMDFTKVADQPTDVAVGDTITYTYTATNTGNVSMSNVSVSDVHSGSGALSAITPASVASLPIGQSATFTATYVITQADIDAGVPVTNVATLDATPAAGTLPPVTDDASVSPETGTGSISFVKTAITSDFTAVGDVLDYEYVVTNTGNVTVSSIAVTDDKIATVSCPVTTLAPTETVTCTASYAVTQADLDAGSVLNNASATASAPSGPVPTQDDQAVVDAIQSPAMTLVKTATETSFAAVGDVLSYEYVVTNTGNVEITALSVSDDKIAAVSCPVTVLAPTESTTCTATYSVTQADIDAGSVTNIASATGDPAGGTLTDAEANETVSADQDPAMDIVKTATDVNFENPGDITTYEYVVTNTGNTTLTDAITVDDNLVTVTCPALPAGGLAPAASLTCTSSYTVTQADLDNGSVTNLATASSGALSSPQTSETIPADQDPALTIVKRAITTDFTAAGDVLSYEFDVTNTGNLTLTGGIDVIDDKIGTISCVTGNLTPTQTQTCTATYVVTQADMDAGTVTNQAYAENGSITSPSVDATVTGTFAPSLSFDKRAVDTDMNAAGDILTYEYDVENTGNVTISDLSVSDDKIASVSCPVTTLAPAETVTCTASYTVTQADIDAGSVTNNASVDGTPAGGALTPPSDSVTVNADQSPELTLDKRALDTTFNVAGDILNYEYDVTNSGNVTMSDIVVSDNLIPTLNCPRAILLPGESMTCEGSYTVTQADVDATSVTNMASVDATPAGGVFTPPTDSVTVGGDPMPSLSLVKQTGASDFTQAGETLSYTYTVVNTGNVSINNLVVSDDKIATVSCPATTLLPGEQMICSADYVTTQADVDAGSVTNIASVDGDASGGTLQPTVDAVTVNATQDSMLAIVKTAVDTAFAAPGDVIAYEYVVTNTGNTTITDPITVSDDKIATVNCPALAASGLAPTDSLTCTAQYAVTQADIDLGSVTNLAAASDGNVASDVASETVNATQAPSLDVVKTATQSSFNEVGDVLSYDYVVTNTGNITITNAISVADDKISSVNCPALPAGGLLPSQSITCQADYMVTQADIDAGEVVNIATASDGTTTSDPVTERVDAVRQEGIEVVKTATDVNFTAPGDLVSYEYVVTNTGNTTLTAPITVSDNRIATVNCPALPAGGLAPASTLTCTAQYVVTQNDLDVGSVTNIASATDGTTTSPLTSETIPASASPALTMAKTSTDSSFSAVGDVLTYSFEIENAGNVTLVGAIEIVDNKIGRIECFVGNFAPGQVETCSADYAVTQADLDAGFVTNDAYAENDGATSPPDSVTIDADQMPSVSLDKSATVSTFAAVGDVLSYEYLVTNTGNTTITQPITVSDDKIASVSCPALPAGGLAPTQSITCEADYSVTQADIDLGAVTNIASATDGVIDPATDTVIVSADQMAALSMTKTALTSDFAAVGDILSYEYVVTNSGNTTIIDPITVSDDKIASVSCPAIPPAGLMPGASLTCSADYAVTQADLDAGSVTNIASASDGTTNSPVVDATVTATQDTGLRVVKSVNETSFAAVGDVLNYSYVVTNTGNTTLSDPVTVSDDKIATVNCPALPAAGLLPQARITCSAPYSVTQADLDAGFVTNIASASSGAVTSPDVSVTLSGDQAPSLSISKRAVTDSYALVGDVLSYEYDVTNTGNVFITDPITVSDDKIAFVNCPALPAAGLAPNAVLTCSADYLVMQDDIDAGSVTNIASASDGTTTSPTDSVTVDAGQTPMMSVTKEVSDLVQVGGPIYDVRYTMTMQNTGNVTLTGIGLSDDLTAILAPATLVNTPVVSAQNFDGSGSANPAFDGQSDIRLLVGDNQLLVGNTALVTIDMRIDTSNGGPATANTAIGSANELNDTVPSNDPNETPETPDDVNPTPLVITDTDGDGVPDYLESAINDRDGDGIPDSEDYDPTGYFYCEENGAILPGGLIIVSGPAGSNASVGTSNNITIVQDGSTGYFQFYVTEPGRYTITPQYPQTGIPSPSRLAQTTALDATSLLPSNPGVLGSSEFGNTGALADFSEAANDPFYFEFDIEAGDPAILMNNIPMALCGNASLSAAKITTSEPERQNDGRYSVSYELTATNTGETLVQSVNLEDDLSAAFGAGNYEIVSAELTDAPADFAATLNAQYDGATDIALLSDGGELDVDERVEVTLDLLVAATTSGEYENTVSANAISALDALSAGNGLTKLEDLVTASDSAAITLESLSDASALRVTKTAQPRTVQIGDPILYTIGVRNESASSMGDLRVTDRLPAGFTYVPGSATLSTDTQTFALEPTVQSRGVLTWDITALNAAPFNGLGAGEQINVNLRALAGTNVTFGAHENRAYVESLTNGTRSAVASAVVDYIPEPTFDCTPVIGRVFDDVNHNGYPDDGEPGLPAVRLVSVNGDIITTDEHGRYHIPCAIIADNERGSNFLLKTDVRSLPLGYAPTSENPRVVRATRGKFVKMNFAAAYMPKLRIDLYAADFDALTGKLVDGAAKRVFARLASMPNTERAVVIYHAAEDEGMDMARSRLALTRDYILSVKSETLSDIALQASWGEAAEYNANILSGDGHNYTHALSDERRINREATPFGDHEQDQSYNRDRDHDGARTVSTGLRGDRNDDDFDDDTHAALPGRSESGEYNSSRPSRLQRWVGWTNSSSAYADGMEIETTVTGLNAVKRLNVGANVVNVNGQRQIIANSYWNYDRFIERAEIRLFEDNTSTRGLPVTGASVLDHVATIDVNSLKGQYLYVLRVYDAEGNFDETSPKLIDLGDAEFDITPEEAYARADDVFGADTLLVDNIRVRGGAVRVYGRNVAGTTATVFGQAVRVDEEGRFVAESLMPIGQQDVEVVVAGENGQQHRVMRSVTVKDKDTFYVGLIEATIGERASVDADGDREYAQGRAAFYVRSRLNDKYSLTATADTGEADIEDILSNFDQKDVRHLLRRLDPDRYYPVYGDDSVIEEDAPTSGKFYARIERDDDYALWGNYRATFNDTEFGRVNRTLYGAKLRWDSNGKPTSYGDERSVIEGFVAEGGSRAARDELRGTGGSVYYLRHGDINIGGEIVKVEIRDEISGLVLETRRLVYGTDYDIDYIQGRILLSRPLASTGNTSRLFTDGNLSGNAQILVVDYEYSPVLGDDDGAVYGLRGSHWIGDSLKIGATYNHDSDGGAESDLYGLDATLQFTAGSYVKAEIAQSEGRGVTTFRSNDGGFSYRDETVTTQAGPATAFALEAAANFRELGFDLDGTAFAYLRDRQAGFAGYGEGSDTHVTQYGGGLTLDVSDNLSITGRADISDDQIIGTNSFAEISGEYDFNDMMSLSAGLSYSDDGRGQSGTALGARADYAFSDDSKVYVFGQLGVQGDNTRTTDRIGAGLEKRVSEKVYLGGEVSTGEDGLGATASVRYEGKDGDELYLAYELPLRSNAGDNFGSLNLGARRRYNDVLSVYGEERFHYDAQGLSGLTHAYGLNYEPRSGFSFGASGEFGEVDDLDRLALSANAGFKDEYMQAGIEGEYRTDENTVTGDVRDTWLLRTTALYQPNDELRLQGKYNMAFSDATNDSFGLQGFNQAKFTEGSLAAAYRPIWDDRLNVLAKYVYLSDLSPSTQSFGGEAINYKQRSQITSIDASYDISERWTLGGKYGYRIGELTSSRTSNDFTESEAELWVGRLDWHVVNDWDAVLEARYLNIGDGITTRAGGLAGIYRHINDNAKIGGGIVWGGIEEEYLAAQDDDGIGWFLNVVGKF